MQFLGAIIIAIIIKLLIDNIKPAIQKSKPAKGGDFIDISEKWISAENMPYQKTDYLFSNRELELFQMFQEILKSSSYTVYPHLSLADVLKVPTGIQNRQEYLYRIKERSLDMVIFKLPHLKPVLVINLKMKGDGKKQQISGQFTENALQSANLKYINIDLDNMPDREQIINNLRDFGLEL